MLRLIIPLLATLICLTACAPAVGEDSESQDLQIIASWSGEYPITALDQLPDGQQQNRVGYLGDADTFAAAWQNFMPGEAPPTVDFARHIVVFSRNVDFYNRTNIFKVTLASGVVEILAMETLSARPIEAKAAMAMAVVPRAGIEAVRLDESTTVTVD